jgi:hypothetical protein
MALENYDQVWMYNHLLYLLYWAVNAGVLYLLFRVWPQSVVLGVNKFVAGEAAVYGGFWLTFIVWVIWDFAIGQEFRLDNNAAWIYFLAANVLGVWVVTRLSGVTGVRVDGLEWIVVTALALNWVQRTVWTKLVGR